MRTALLLAAFFAAFTLTARDSAAQVRFLAYTGYSLSGGVDLEACLDPASTACDDELETTGGIIAGVGLEFGVPLSMVALKIRPSVETVFLNNFSDEDIDDGDVEDLVGTPTASALLGGLPALPDDFEISQSLYQANLDLIAEFGGAGAPVVPYIGAGATYAMYSTSTEVDNEDSDLFEADDSAAGINLLAGIRGGGQFAPFLQGRYSIYSLCPDFDGDATAECGDGADEFNELNGGISILAGLSIGF